jgi:hypothetical protein
VRQIQLTANLSITSDAYDVSINSSEDVVRVAIHGSAVPAASWSWLKRLYRYRKLTRAIQQRIEIIYNDQLFITQKAGKITHLNWPLAAKSLWQSVFG